MKSLSLRKLIFGLVSVAAASTTWASSPWLSLGASHACAVTTAGKVECWGKDDFGQLGDGTVGMPTLRPYAAEIANAHVNIAAVVTGDNHSCALKADGNVLCWGANNVGQLGSFSNTPSPSPVEVAYIGPNLDEVPATQLATGISHTCALTSTRRVLCWGEGSNGQLGNGLEMDSNVPVWVNGIDGTTLQAIAVAAGGHHSCALLANNTVHCWGFNSSGQLGIGNQLSKSGPTEVTSLAGKNVTSMAAGRVFTCALTSLGEVWCWGNNANGQVGVPAAGTFSLSPVMTLSTGVAEIAAGSVHACARMSSDNKLKCWGLNTQRQLGIMNDITNKTTPTDAIDIPPVRYVTIGGTGTAGSTCARRLLDDVTICWGDNANGQLGDGTTTDLQMNVIEMQVKVNDGNENFERVAVGGQHTCLIKSAQLFCWGQGTFGQLGDGQSGNSHENNPLPKKVSALNNVTMIAAGGTFTCAVATDSNNQNPGLYCWGAGSSGQVGNGQYNVINANPVLVSAIRNVSAVSAGAAHACAIATDSNDQNPGLYCWGWNFSGQLGDNSFADNATPARVLPLNNVSGVAAGHSHTCAFATDNNDQNLGLYCWGSNSQGQLSVGAVATKNPNPTLIPTLVNVSAFMAGGSHTCAKAVKNNQPGFYCWGGNASGQLGIGNFINTSTPTNALGISNVAQAISAGSAHGCTLAANNSGQNAGLYCWGNDDNGQLGDGTIGPNDPTPKIVPGLNKITAVATGQAHTCALAADANDRNPGLYCWGEDSRGQLGDGTVGPDNPVPTLVIPYTKSQINDVLFKSQFEPAQ